MCESLPRQGTDSHALGVAGGRESLLTPASPVVNDQRFGYVRLDPGDERPVSRMDQVGVPVGEAREGDQEAVRVAIGQVFDAHIGAPLKALDLGDLGGKAAKACSMASTCAGVAVSLKANRTTWRSTRLLGWLITTSLRAKLGTCGVG